MKKRFLLAGFFMAISLSLFCQTIPPEIAGTWLGKLNVGIELRLVFKFSIDNDSLIVHCTSPDQSAEEIPISQSVYSENNKIHVGMEKIYASYDGTYDPASQMIIGAFTQAGKYFALDLSKVDSVTGPSRPQNPKKPYPYREDEVFFKNEKTDSVMLAGTLTIPDGKGPFKAVVLVTGSGPQNRDEFLLNHSPFLVLADYLTRNNIIVLRYDDRGVGGSTGNFSGSTSADFASDANAAVSYLNRNKKELHISEIGIAGHSEGGLIAPMAANENKQVDFIVLIAGTGIPGDSLLRLQQTLILRSVGVPENIIEKYEVLQKTIMYEVENGSDWDTVTNRLVSLQKEFLRKTSEEDLNMLGTSKSDSSNSIVNFYANDWMKFFLTYDPAESLKKVNIPVLAINGSKDLQVPSDINLAAIEAALKKAGNTDYKIVELPGLNHLFQHCVKCTVMEYGEIEETFSEEAMKIIADWVNGLNH